MPGNGSSDLGKLLKIQQCNIPPNRNLLEAIRGSEELERVASEIQQISQVTVHLFPPGKIGGNHYHKHKREIFVASGDIKVYLYDPLKGSSYSCVVPAGFRFELVPWVAHTLHNHGNEYFVAAEFTNLAFNPNDSKKDVYMLDKCLVTGNLLKR